MSQATDIIAVSFSGVSMLVASWAGWTAHQARRWQQGRDAERKETRIGFSFAHSTGPRSGWPLARRGSQRSSEPPTVYVVSTSVINNGEETEYVSAAFLEQAKGHPRSGIRIFGSEGGIDDTEPYELRPRGVLHIPIELTRVQVETLRDGFVAIAWLGSGVEAHSDVETLESSFFDELS